MRIDIPFVIGGMRGHMITFDQRCRMHVAKHDPVVAFIKGVGPVFEIGSVVQTGAPLPRGLLVWSPTRKAVGVDNTTEHPNMPMPPKSTNSLAVDGLSTTVHNGTDGKGAWTERRQSKRPENGSLGGDVMIRQCCAGYWLT